MMEGCNRCHGGVRIAVIAALDDPRGFVEKPWVCPCVKGNRIEAAERLIVERHPDFVVVEA